MRVCLSLLVRASLLWSRDGLVVLGTRGPHSYTQTHTHTMLIDCAGGRGFGMSTTTTTEQLYTAHAGECRDIVFILPRVPLRFYSSSSSYACVPRGSFLLLLDFPPSPLRRRRRSGSVSQSSSTDLFLVVVVYATHTNTAEPLLKAFDDGSVAWTAKSARCPSPLLFLLLLLLLLLSSATRR